MWMAAIASIAKKWRVWYEVGLVAVVTVISFDQCLACLTGLPSLLELASDLHEQELQNMVTHMMSILDDDNNNSVSRAEFIAAVEAGKLDSLIEISRNDAAQLIQSGDLTQSHTLSADRRAMIAERMSERQPPAKTVEVDHIDGKVEGYVFVRACVRV